MTLRRVLAALAGCVLVMSGLVAPSGAAAAPSVPDPVVSVEPLSGEDVSASEDKDAASSEADEGKTAEPVKKPAPEPKPPSDSKSDEPTSDESAGSSGKEKPSSDSKPAKPATGDDEEPDEPEAADSDDGVATDAVKPSAGGKAKLPSGDEESSDGDAASESDVDDAGVADGDVVRPPVRMEDEGGSSRGGEFVPVKPLMSGQLSGIVAEVKADGTTADNGPVEVAGVVLDDDDRNGVVATNDRVTYEVTATYSGSVAADDTLSLVGTLPEGVTWLEGSYSETSCDVSRAGENTRTLTCEWKSRGETDKTFTWFASASSPPFAGSAVTLMSFAPTFKDGNNSVLEVVGPRLNVVASPAVSPNVMLGTNLFGTEYSGPDPAWQDAPGVAFTTNIRLTSYASDTRGLEALEGPYSFDVRVPSNAVLVSVAGGSSAQGASASQPGGKGGVLHITVPGNSQVGAYPDYAATIAVTIFIPYSELELDVLFTARVQVINFDPVGLSGRSNWGDGFATGQEPDAPCVEVTNCDVRTVLLRSDAVMSQSLTFYREVNGPTNPIFGRSTGASPQQSGRSRVVPGEAFISYLTVGSAAVSATAMTGASSCVTWDREFAALRGQARIGGAPVVGDGYVLEYASVDGLTPGSFACGRAGSGDDTAIWKADPTKVADGPESVNAVRLTLTSATVEPGQSYWLAIPVARTTTAQSLALGPSGSITFYNTQSADQAFGSGSSAASISAWVGADLALVRASTQVLSASGASWEAMTTAAGGEQVTFRVSPTVIGPAADLNTVAANTKIQLTFSSACMDVSLALVALAAYHPVVTSGTGTCGEINSTGPVVTLDVGDVLALGSSTPAWITHATVGGHETRIGAAPIEVPVLLSTRTPSGSTVRMTTMISSDSDTTVAVWSTPSSYVWDRTTEASVGINSASTFTARKSAYTVAPGFVDPGESYVYSLLMSNTEPLDYGVSSMVDVLPFEGDPRLTRPGPDGVMGTGDDVQLADGLAGGQRLKVTDVSASMVDGGVPPHTLPVSVYCSSHDPATIYASLAADKSGGAIPGAFGWTDCSGSVPPGTTAVRFVTSGGLVSYGSLSATIRVIAPALTVGGSVVNDMAYYVQPGTGGSLREGFVGVPAVLTSSAATLSGTVRQDLNFNTTVDAVGAGSDGWWPSGAVVELVTPGGEPVIDLVSGDPYTTVIGADGAFVFPLIPAGEYRLRVAGVDPGVWRIVSPTAAVTVAAGSTDTTVNLLYQEIVPDPVLVDDAAKTGVGGTVTTDVTANDALSTPSVSTVTPAQLVLKGSGTTANGGTYVVSSTPGGVYAGQPQVTFTASATWPAGESGLSYLESFEYSWTNAVGVEKTATVTVTVQKPPSASGGTAKIPVDGSHTFDAGPQTYGTIETASVTDGPSQGTVTVDTAGNVTFDGTGAEPGVYSFTVEWVDDLGQKCVSEYTVTVQAPPTASGGTAKIPVGGSHTFDADPQPSDNIRSASVTKLPSQGTASVDHATGLVTFDGTGAEPGEYSFEVTWVDDLNQTCTSTYTVTVQAKPTLAGDEVAMGVSASDDSMRVSPVTTGEITSVALDALDLLPTISVELVDGVLTVVTNGADPGEYTFTVTVTDDLGQTGEAVFTVKVFAGPVWNGEGASATIPEGGTHTFELDIETKRTITDATVEGAPAGATVSAKPDGTVVFEANDLAPDVYEFEVTFTDDLGQWVTVPMKVTVQARPELPGGAIVMPTTSKTGNTELKVAPVTTGEIKKVELDDAGLPDTVKVVLDEATGELTVSTNGAKPGEYSFKVKVTDDLGQEGEATFTVTVRSLEVTGEPTSEVKVKESNSHRPVVNHPEHVVSVKFVLLPTQGTVTYDEKTGEVRYVAGDRRGTFTYELEWTDDLGQTARLSHTVFVGEDNPDPEPTTPTPVPPTPEPTTPTPTPSPTQTTEPPVVGTGGTVTGGGGPSALGVVALVVAAIAILFATAFVISRRRTEDSGT